MAILDSVEGKRGYLLPYHRMLDTHAPELLAAYDRFYEQLTLLPRVLTLAEREIVWVALLVAAREEHGTIHLRRAETAGLGREEICRSVALAGACESFPAAAFAGRHWADWTAPHALAQLYLQQFEAICGDRPAAVLELAAVVCHAATRRHDGMALHLPRYFAAGGAAAALAEGLSYLLLPCGGPTLIDAVDAWAREAEAGGYPGPYASEG